MAVDPEGKNKGETLRRWYIKRGFQRKGRLSKIVFKRGHWFVPYDDILTPCHINRPPGSRLYFLKYGVPKTSSVLFTYFQYT